MNNNNIFSYNLNSLDTNNNTNNKNNIKNLESILNKLKTGCKLEGYLGNSNNGEIYLIKHNKNKYICKTIHNSNVNKRNIKNHFKLGQKIKKHPIAKKYVNPIINYKIYKNRIYILIPYFNGYNLDQLNNKLLEVNLEEYKKIIKYLVKEILTGLSNIHKLGINHNYLNNSSILVELNNKNTDIKIKFIDFDITANKHIFLPKHKTRQNKVNKRSKKIGLDKKTKGIIKDRKDCGYLLTGIINNKYKYDFEKNNQDNNKKGFLSSALSYFNKNNYQTKSDNVEDLIDEDILLYLNLINEKMINNQISSLKSLLKDILLNEKYREEEEEDNYV